MLIASKYEEIWAPEVRDFVYISDRAYTKEQILSMEKLILNTLKFDLTVPTASTFLHRYLKAANIKDKLSHYHAGYLVELAIAIPLQLQRLPAIQSKDIRKSRGRCAMRLVSSFCCLPCKLHTLQALGPARLLASQGSFPASLAALASGGGLVTFSSSSALAALTLLLVMCTFCSGLTEAGFLAGIFGHLPVGTP